MKEEKDAIREIAEIRSMMERSSKFLSLSGWAGIMAGLFALTGAFIAYKYLHFQSLDPANLSQVIYLAIAVLLLSFFSATYFSMRKAAKRGEKLWNNITRQLLMHMAVPLIAGGLLTLILVSKGFIELAAPFTLMFYGIALYNAGKYTIDEVKFMGLIQIILGLVSAIYVQYGLFFWAIGFGLLHIIYGVYMHFRYEQ